MKTIIVVPDGMADRPIEELNQKTPLEVAHAANMDFLAKNGLTGLVRTIPKGMKPGSDVGNLALLGYDPRSCYTGRAPLEAANLGVDLKENEIAFRCNLVTIRDGLMEDYSAGHIQTQEAALLIQALNEAFADEDSVRFFPGKSYRHLAILTVRNVADFQKIPTTPPHDILGKPVHDHEPSGPHGQTLLRIMEKAQRVLENHSLNAVRVDLKENPANAIWLWGQGVRPNMESFEHRFGIQGGIISAVDLVNGIGRLAGLEVIDVPGITGYYDTNYAGKAEYALDALKHLDFVFIHVEGPDEAGHNGDWKAKVHCIEHIDKEIIGPILNHFNDRGDFRLLVLPDHPTPVELRTHTADPVNFVMYGTDIPAGGTDIFCERTASEQGIKFQSGEELIRFFLRRPS